MQNKLHLYLIILCLLIAEHSFGQKQLRLSKIDAPSFLMGSDQKQLQADYNQMVLSLKPGADLSTFSEKIQAQFPLLKVSETFNEYHALILNYSGSQQRSTLKRLFKNLQQINEVAQVYPFYKLDDASLYYFDILNYKAKESSSSEDIQKLFDKLHLTWLEAYESDYPGGISFLRVAPGKSIFKVSKRLHQSGLFEYVYPMSNRIVSEDYVPNDPEFGNLWHLDQSNDADIDAPEAWDQELGNSSLVIAIQELNGFDLTHPDMVPNIISPYNAFLDVNDAQFLDNTHTHGTRVMGCSNAAGNNNLGVTGVAFNLKVMPIILTAATSNSVNSNTLQRAGDHIIANGNVVAISNSWSGSSYDAAEDDQFQRMRSLSRNGLGAVLLGSTSNTSDMQIRYPACYKNVVGVGRTTQTDFRYSSSTWHDSVDVSAPGSSILTTDIVGTIGAAGDYTTASGTSFSTPIAAGVVGLMASANPTLTGRELKDYLEQSCEAVGNYPYHPVQGRPNGVWHEELGYGRINALKAVLLCKQSVNASNSCADAQALNQITSNQFCLNNVNLLGASESLPPRSCSGLTSAIAHDTWFTFNAINNNMTITVSPMGSSFDPVVEVFASCGSNLVACINDETAGFGESLSLSSLTLNEEYWVRVYHFSSAGELTSETNFDICAIAPGVNCSSPTGLFSSNVTADEADLSWNAVSGANGYEVAVRRIGTTAWVSYLVNTVSFTANNLPCNSSLEWRVRSTCSNGAISAWSAVSNFNTQDCTDCLRPFNLTATSVTSNSAVLSWEAIAPTCTIDGFDGAIAEGTAMNGTGVDDWFDIGTNAVSITGLQANTTYTFEVRQDCDCGGLARSPYVYYTFVTPGGPNIDIVANKEASSSSLLVNGTSIEVSASFKNEGASNTGSFQNAFYLSSSPYFDSYDYAVNSSNVSNIMPFTSVVSTYNTDLCTLNIPDGTYYVGVYGDNDQEVSEFDETNNFMFWPEKPVTLNCNPPTFNILTLTASTSSGGTVNGGGTYTTGFTVPIEAVPNAGWEFINWEENGVLFSTNANDTVILNSDRTLVANFGSLTSIANIGTAAFSIVPNPTQGSFTIQVNDELLGAECRIYNINGQLVKSFELNNLETPAQLNEAKGVYFIHITNSAFDINQKIVLE